MGDHDAMNVSLTTALESFVRRKVASGLYNNASEVVREALRLMVDRETGGQSVPRKSAVVATLKALEPELKQRGVASAAIFGSVVRGQARSDSDVDVLIRHQSEHPFRPAGFGGGQEPAGRSPRAVCGRHRAGGHQAAPARGYFG